MQVVRNCPAAVAHFTWWAKFSFQLFQLQNDFYPCSFAEEEWNWDLIPARDHRRVNIRRTQRLVFYRSRSFIAKCCCGIAWRLLGIADCQSSSRSLSWLTECWTAQNAIPPVACFRCIEFSISRQQMCSARELRFAAARGEFWYDVTSALVSIGGVTQLTASDLF